MGIGLAMIHGALFFGQITVGFHMRNPIATTCRLRDIAYNPEASGEPSYLVLPWRRRTTRVSQTLVWCVSEDTWVAQKSHQTVNADTTRCGRVLDTTVLKNGELSEEEGGVNSTLPRVNLQYSMGGVYHYKATRDRVYKPGLCVSHTRQ